jgi:uncharacterized protein (TIGR02246 family)
MRQALTAILFVTILLNGNLQDAMGQRHSPADAKIEADIGKIIRDYYDAWHRMDEAAVMALHAYDGFYYSERNGFERFEAAHQNFRAYFKTPEATRTRFSYQIDDLKVFSANADTAIANYKIVTKMNQGTLAREVQERYTNVFTKRDGRWKLVAEHSSELPKPVPEVVAGMPAGWIRTPLGTAERYSMTVDTVVKRSGSASASLAFACGATDGFGSLAQAIAADDYHGKRVRLSGWLKTENAQEAGLWMRLDGEKRLLGFDNMMPRAVKGTTDWNQYEVVLNVPPETVNILFGTLLAGTGRVWVDDIKLEVVGKEVPVTNLLSAAEMQTETPNRMSKKKENKQPANLGFENGSWP